MATFFKKAIGLLEKLSSKPRIDGLEITGDAVKYVFLEDNTIRTLAVRLVPGTIVDGKLANREGFIKALQNIKTLLVAGKKEKVFRVNVVLPTALIFTQSFSVPNVGSGDLGESVGLNLEMISPIPRDEANMSAEIVSERDFNYEFFGAFAEKKEVGNYQSALAEAGFAPVSFEFQALALSRFVRAFSLASKNLTLVFELTADGIELFLLAGGKTSFTYFKTWQSIRGNAPSLSKDLFDRTVVEEIGRVLNFASGKFGISPDLLLFLAPGFEDEVSGTISGKLNFKVTPLVSPRVKASPGFYGTIGAALKWEGKAGNENLESIDLGGEDLSRAIFEEQMINFISLWRGIISSVLALFLLAYVVGAIFVVNQYKTVDAHVKNFQPPLDETKLADLVSKASSFNETVSELGSIRSSSYDFYTPLKHLVDVAKANGITIESITVNSISSPVNVLAEAGSYDAVLTFRNALSADAAFSNVDVPLTQIVIQSDNSVTFSLSFNFSS